MINRKFHLKMIATLTFIAQSIFGTLSFGQGLDQSIFDQIKQQTGSTTDTTQVKSPLDELREQDYLDRLNTQLEQRLNAGPSMIEEDYNARLNSFNDQNKVVLKQYGYDIFNRLPLQNQIATGAAPDNYRLGVGDALIVSFKGAREEVIAVNVDREGRLIIPALSPFSAAGLTFGEVRASLEAQVSERLVGTEVFVSVATFRQISVLVAGEVENPAMVATTSFATPIEALLHVGGVKKTGSLRNITLHRGSEIIPIDLYDIIESANSEIITLRDGDRISVPTIGATVAVDGIVIRPGIYEMPAGQNKISATEVLDFSGGTLRTNGNALTHMRYDESGRLNFEKLDLNGTVASGEVVIANLLENSEVGRVTLSGHVKTPGVRSVKVYNNVRDLIGSVKNLTENPYLLFGVVERTDVMTQTRSLIPFSPQKVLYGDENIDLIDEDKVVLYGRRDVEFLRSDVIRDAIFTSEYLEKEFLPSGNVNRNFCPPVKKLAKIISDTQSERFATAIRAVFVRRESTQEQEQGRELLLNNEELLVLEEQRQQSLLAISGASANQSFQQVQEQVAAGQGGSPDDEGNMYLNCPMVYQEVDNLLSFTLEHIISVDGAVRLPGVYPITDNTAVDLLLSVSGGTSNDANMSKIELTNYSQDANAGNLVMNWEFIDSSISDLNVVQVNPGGGVRVASVYTNFESGAVLLSGEFVEPGVYTIRKGEKLSSLIARAGGITEQAYPYGAIFTRDRVKEIQRQEMQQTAQRLQSAMVSASVKKNVDAQGVVALQRLVQGMADREFLGRVVIESDPVVLGLDPSKDIVLEAGDSLFMPKRPNFIVTVGDVLNPSALQFVPGKGVGSYLEEVGGFARVADEDRVFVVYPNGVAKPISLASWGGDRNLSIPPGSAIVVPTDLSPYDTITLAATLGDIFSNLAVSAASLAVLIRN